MTPCKLTAPTCGECYNWRLYSERGIRRKSFAVWFKTLPNRTCLIMELHARTWCKQIFVFSYLCLLCIELINLQQNRKRSLPQVWSSRDISVQFHITGVYIESIAICVYNLRSILECPGFASLFVGDLFQLMYILCFLGTHIQFPSLKYPGELLLT